MITEETRNGILREVDALIEEGMKLACLKMTKADFRVFVDEEAGQVAIMFLDGPEGMQSWSGNLYEIQDGRLEMVDRGCFDFVDINRWPCFNYKELDIK